jgi:hypothetical protein
MVLSQRSPLGRLSGVTRRVTLLHEPQYSTSTGSWLVNGLDGDKQQWQVDLTVLPPGITKDMIKPGQKWFVERGTTYNRLFKYVGEFTPYSYLDGPIESTFVPPFVSTNVNVLPSLQISGTLGNITAVGTNITVPIPGLYHLTVDLQGSILQWDFQGSKSGYGFIRSYISQPVLLPSGNNPYNIQVLSTVSGTVSGSFVLAYNGPIFAGAR